MKFKMNPKLKQIIINILGLDESEIVPDAEFILDLNSSPIEIAEIKQQIEEEFDIILPSIDSNDYPTTVKELDELIQDLCL